MPRTPRPTLIERIVNPRSPVQYLLFCILAFALNKVSGRFPDWADFLFAGFLAVLFALMWWASRRVQAGRLRLHVHKQQPQGVSGLVLLVSPYDTRNPASCDSEQLSMALRRALERPVEQLTAVDFEAIGLVSSNLAPLVQAIDFHAAKGTLRDVWLITTRTEFVKGEGGLTSAVRGSEDAGALLPKYVAFRHGKGIAVHQQGYELEGAWDYITLWEKAEQIFRQAPYKPEALLADVTGGTKMMSVALTLACIAPGRKMQYMHSDRDWRGHPLPNREPTPVVVDRRPAMLSERRVLPG
jgi:hypothetical protein